MKKATLSVIILFILIISINSCSKKRVDVATTFVCNTSITFSNNIKRILDANCNVCHGVASGYPLATSKWTYDGSYSNAYNRRIDINSLIAAGIMPQFNPLPTAVKDSVACWVSNGAPN